MTHNILEKNRKWFVVTLLSLLGVFVMFFLYLQFPMFPIIERLFALYTNGSLLFVYGMLKGHNYGVCRKCGEDHGPHPREGCCLTEETKRKIGEGNSGKKRTPEHRRKLSEAFKGRIFSPGHLAKIVAFNKSPEKRRQVSEQFKGKPSHRKGKHLPTLHRINIARGLKESKIFPEVVKEFHEKEVKDFLRKFYDLPKDAEFVPASKYDHVFAREVLIEETSHRSFVHIRLPECPEWVRNNGNGKNVPVVI